MSSTSTLHKSYYFNFKHLSLLFKMNVKNIHWHVPVTRTFEVHGTEIRMLENCTRAVTQQKFLSID